jgi:hypothetical protein
MKFCRIVRLEKSDQGVIGVLIIDGAIFCFTLEPDVNSKGKPFIPQGFYHCDRFDGAKWKNTFEIKVPGRTAILFHSGNVESDSEGCVLLGATTGKLKGNRAVLNSGDTFRLFQELTKNDKDLKLFIEDRFLWKAMGWMLTSLLVFAANALCDVLACLYIQFVTAKKRIAATLVSMAIVALSYFTILFIVADPWYALPAILGAAFGTYFTIKK